MAINTSSPVLVGRAPIANYFEIAHIDTSNRADGIVVDVWVNGFMKDAGTGAKVKVADIYHQIKDGDADFVVAHQGLSADRLEAVSADFLARAGAYVAEHVPAGLAAQGGYRDAVYAELTLAGKLPAGS